MIFYILGLALLMGVAFLLALIAVGVLGMASGGNSMNNPAGTAFEVYRYAVCFVMVIVFALSAFMAITTVLGSFMGGAGGGDPVGMTTNGLAVLLSAGVFFLHWRMKSPVNS